MFRWQVVAALVAGVGLPLCVSAREVNFEQDVRPILKTHCFRCHGDEEKIEGGLDLRLVRFMRKGGDSGRAITQDGKPERSLLLQRIQSGEMPPEGAQPLTKGQIKLISGWLSVGAPTRHPEPETVEPSGITEEDRRFWAFQPWQSRPPSQPLLQSGVRNFIDAIVQHRLEQLSYQPSPPADRRTLLRRVSFSLIGLAPTWDELQDFLNDTSPDAWERAIDRLLASPHYGERWARPWLDMGRYVDQTPWWVVSADRAWLYRDWVIRAFNEDRPYDDFVRLQLAADQLPDTPPPEYAALGFLGLSPTYWKELRLSPDVIKTVVAEEWDERIDTISRTFLGLTVSCARCHDHKFDPVTMQDYYALAGVLASTQLVDKPQVSYSIAESIRVVQLQVADLERRIAQLKDQDPAETARLQELITRLKTSLPDYATPWVHAVEDTSLIVQPEGDDKTRLEYRFGEVMDMPMFRRGNPSAPTETTVPRRFLTVLSPGEPHPFEHGSGRLDLAEAILNDARPLATRVQVNRIWTQHFGKGIVRTPSDFGRQGEPPTDQNLLDAVAAGFVSHGWSHKWLHRRIVESATYRQSSRETAQGKERDPDNRNLWRMNRRRLDIEPYRDAILAAAGQLDDRLSGPSLNFDDPANLRRTIYGRVVREEQHSLLRLYDFPDASSHSPNREQTTTPLQQLFVLNGPLFLRQSAVLAEQLGTPSPATMQTSIDDLYHRLFQRDPTDRERQLAQSFLTENIAAPGKLAAYVQALLATNELLFLD
jgi:cytochrome c553